jgi:hypothetical protein
MRRDDGSDIDIAFHEAHLTLAREARPPSAARYTNLDPTPRLSANNRPRRRSWPSTQYPDDFQINLPGGQIVKGYLRTRNSGWPKYEFFLTLFNETILIV